MAMEVMAMAGMGVAGWRVRNPGTGRWRGALPAVLLGTAVVVLALAATVLAGPVRTENAEMAPEALIWRSSPTVNAATRTHARGTAATAGPQVSSLASPSGRSHHQEDHGALGDARAYLRDAAAAARHAGAGPWHGETRTELWINAPASIGSTSPRRLPATLATPASRPTTAAELPGQQPPRALRARNEDDAAEDGAVTNPGSTALGLGRLHWERRRDGLPGVVGAKS
jgi:hypothetical protein